MLRRTRSKAKAPAGDPLDGRILFGTNLRQRRLALGLTQEAVSVRAGLHLTYVGSVERGERNVSIDNICRLAWAVEATPGELLHPH